MGLLSPWRRWARPAVVALALAALTAVPAPPWPPRRPWALPGPRRPASSEVDQLDIKVKTLAEAHGAAQARLDGLIQAAHRCWPIAGPCWPRPGPRSAQIRAEQGRQEAARRVMVAAASARARALGFTALADTPAPNATAAAAVRAALRQVGKPYRWGATGPGSFDCSGLTRFAYADAGLSLPRTSRQQWSAGGHVRVEGLRSGDLVFWAHDPADPSTTSASTSARA